MAIEDIQTKRELAGFIEQTIARQPPKAVLRFITSASGVAAWGTSSATWTAAAVSAAVTVPHGLTVVPALVVVTLREPYNNIPSLYDITSKDATNFVYEGRTTTGGNSTGTQNTYWFAVG